MYVCIYVCGVNVCVCVCDVWVECRADRQGVSGVTLGLMLIRV